MCLKSAVGQSHKTSFTKYSFFIYYLKFFFGHCPQACWGEGSCCRRNQAAVALPLMTWLHQEQLWLLCLISLVLCKIWAVN